MESKVKRKLVVNLIVVANGFDQHPVATTFIRIIEVRMKRRAFDRARIFAAGERRRKREGTTVEPRV